MHSQAANANAGIIHLSHVMLSEEATETAAGAQPKTAAAGFFWQVGTHARGIRCFGSD